MLLMYFYVEWGGELYGRLSMHCILIEDAGDSDSFHRVNKLFENVKKK